MKKFDVESQAVFMCGISGSGKTHYARQLENKGFIRISTDALIWQKTGGKLFSLSPQDQKRMFAECGSEMRLQILHFLESGRKVVVDATHCKRAVRDEIRKLCNAAGIKPLFVYCEAGSEEELWMRLSQRKGSGPDDLIVSREQLADYWNGFERPEEDETDFIYI